MTNCGRPYPLLAALTMVLLTASCSAESAAPSTAHEAGGNSKHAPFEVTTIGSDASAITALALSSNDQWLVIGTHRGDLSLWELLPLGTRRKWSSSIGPAEVTAVAIAPSMSICLAATTESGLRAVRLEDGTVLSKFSPSTLTLVSISISTDGRFALTGDAYRGAALRLWDIALAKEMGVLGTHAGVVDAWFVGGGRVHSTDDLGQIREWTVNDLADDVTSSRRNDLVERIRQHTAIPEDERFVNGYVGGIPHADGLTPHAHAMLRNAAKHHLRWFTMVWSADQSTAISWESSPDKAPLLWSRDDRSPQACPVVSAGDYLRRAVFLSNGDCIAGTQQGTIVTISTRSRSTK